MLICIELKFCGNCVWELPCHTCLALQCGVDITHANLTENNAA